MIRSVNVVTGMTPMSTTACFDARKCTGVFVKPTAACPADSQAPCAVSTGNGGLAVGDVRVLDALLGHHDSAAAAALDRGELVVFDKDLADNGRSMLVFDALNAKDGSQRVTPVASHIADVGRSGAAVNGILGPGAAERLRITSQPWGYLLSTSRVPTQSEQDTALSDLSKWSTSLVVERGYQPERWNYGLLALAGAAALVTLGATAIATALSAADSRPDLVTLAAVGAAPLLRRKFAAHQAATVAVTAVSDSLASGELEEAVALAGQIGIRHRAHGGMPFAAPWQTIAIVVVGVPVIAAAATAALTRSRLPSERRAT